MSTASSEARVSALEAAMLELARAQAHTESSIDRLVEENRAFRDETKTSRGDMQAFKDEMQTSRGDTQAFKDEMKTSRGDMQAFKDEMQTSRGDMQAFRDEMRASERKAEAQREESNRRWGELSNKMGTLVEDIIHPSIPEIFKRAFGQDQGPDCSIRLRRHHRTEPGRMRAFDAVASGGGIFVINETRSRLVPEAISAFVEILRDARSYFPEAEGQKVVGALATFYADPSLVRNGERQGLLMLGLGTGLMQILNVPGFEPREF